MSADEAQQETRISISLPFSAAICRTCDQARLPGPCPGCGAEIPAVDDVDDDLKARQAALGSLAQEASALVTSFTVPPGPQISVDADQFMACVEELDLIARAGSLAGLAHELTAIDFGDSAAIGGPARRVVADQLKRVRQLRDDAWELSRLDVGGPGGQLRDVALEACRWGAELVDIVMRAVVAPTPAAAHAAAGKLQSHIDQFDFIDRLASIAEEAFATAHLDDNTRIARVVGRPGDYLDEFGMPDAGAVLSVYSDSDSPLEELGRAAARYFDSVLGADLTSDDATSAVLVLPAVVLATLDRPLVAYRAARLTYDLCCQAQGVDSAAVIKTVQRATDEAPRLLAAASRIQQSFRLLARGGDLVDDATVLATGLNAYREVAETTYRMLGRMLLDLDRIVGAQPARRSDGTPTLGPLTEQLGAANDFAPREFGAACDVPLRNAVAHSQYRWDSQDETLHDLETGQTWTTSQLEQTLVRLMGAVVGADAGWACFVVRHNIDTSPAWATDGNAPEAIHLVAVLCFSPRGFHVHSVEDAGATVVIEPPAVTDPAALIPGLAGMASHVPDAPAYRVKSAKDATTLLQVDRDALWRALDADPHVRDLAVVQTTASAMIASGRDPSDTVEQMAIFQAKVIAVQGLQALAERWSTSTLTVLRRRLLYLRAFVATAPHKRRELNKLRDKLLKAEASGTAATVDGDARTRLVDQLMGLIAWADQRGIEWPPRLGNETD